MINILKKYRSNKPMTKIIKISNIYKLINNKHENIDIINNQWNVEKLHIFYSSNKHFNNASICCIS